ncbi:MAG: tRNA (N6-threonylcarbamoyladenosine(37)-N6)-methyltransferase TrmO [Sphaerochaetaceae bacterium]|jgi:tRNA (adenine37-N6)-methyltransferase|nr:tRNA (N6-threonylcarbamoyladenosine(37)-N6)-methyltransferase TrmO [Sphaerochaetaceae bacterium]NLY06947.1 tRNA (N6-threonylcarbamoyladenosine(37)-N6)-methyltransferase TrmO [Spirochaetales bacterium]
MNFEPIGHIHCDFATKFGIPRQSGLVNNLESRIIMEPKYRNPEAFRGLEDCTHIWLIWLFSEAIRDEWSPTVRPPRLGGEKRMGVFATRSPFRPNPIGLSSVLIKSIEYSQSTGPILHILGADLMDGTPILDIKPYLAYTDSHPDAKLGYVNNQAFLKLEVVFPPESASLIPEDKCNALKQILSLDPRPRCQHDPLRIYGMEFAGFEIQFTADERQLHVISITPIDH